MADDSPASKLLVAEIPEPMRTSGARWLLLHEEPQDDIELTVVGPNFLLRLGPRENDFHLRFTSWEEAFAAASTWGVEGQAMVLAPTRIDYGGMPDTYSVITQSAYAASLVWKSLEKPNPGGHCIVCIHSYLSNGEIVPTTHIVDGPPLSGNRQYWEICRLCYNRFIARPGVTELMEQLLRGDHDGVAH